MKGADVMRPGIVKYDRVGRRKETLSWYRDEKKGRGLAVGRANVSSGEWHGHDGKGDLRQEHAPRWG